MCVCQIRWSLLELHPRDHEDCSRGRSHLPPSARELPPLQLCGQKTTIMRRVVKHLELHAMPRLGTECCINCSQVALTGSMVALFVLPQADLWSASDPRWKARCWILKQTNLWKQRVTQRVSAWVKCAHFWLRSWPWPAYDRRDNTQNPPSRRPRQHAIFNIATGAALEKNTKLLCARNAIASAVHLNSKMCNNHKMHAKKPLRPLALLGLGTCSPRHLKLLGYSIGLSPCVGGASGGPMRGR